MRAFLQRVALASSSGALACYGVLVLASLLGRAEVGPQQAPLLAGNVLPRVAEGALWGIPLAVFLGRAWSQVMLAALVLSLAPALRTWLVGGPWPAASGPWAPAWILGAWALWGGVLGMLGAWLGGAPKARPGRGKRR
jgi:hypothetical protein